MTVHLADTGPVTPSAPVGVPRCDRCAQWRGLSELLDLATGKRVLLGECRVDGQGRLETDRCGAFVPRGVAS